MLTVILACALFPGGQPVQPQANSGTQSTTDPSQMSLAERAAAARKAAAERAYPRESSRPDGPPPLTPEQRGTVRGNAYVNEALHFQIALTNWQPLTEERIARDEDTARRLVNPDQRGRRHTVFYGSQTTPDGILLCRLCPCRRKRRKI